MADSSDPVVPTRKRPRTRPLRKRPDTGRLNLLTHIKQLGLFLATGALDTMFIIVWAFVAKGGRLALDWIGEIADLDGFAVEVMQVMFTVSTLGVVGAYVARDLVVVGVYLARDLSTTVRRIWSQHG